MDLKEVRDSGGRRHPWETARLKALRGILEGVARDGARVLDIGCGDGYIARELFKGTGVKEVIGVDINLSDEKIAELTALSSGLVSYRREIPRGERFDLVLLLDVVEHVKDDRSFLENVVTASVKSGGKVIITVPAFMALYGSHDRFLGHYRRYTLSGLTELAGKSGLKVAASGYLFATLLIPKCAGNYLRRSTGPGRWQGVGDWNGGALLTALIDRALSIDSALLKALGRLGLKLPGLTCWALCERPR